jgi:hypothetical protein
VLLLVLAGLGVEMAEDEVNLVGGAASIRTWFLTRQFIRKAMITGRSLYQT